MLLFGVFFIVCVPKMPVLKASILYKYRAIPNNALPHQKVHLVMQGTVHHAVWSQSSLLTAAISVILNIVQPLL